jgi:hypothetical protein
VSVSRSEEDDARSSSKYRAALEALFAPKPAAALNSLSEGQAGAAVGVAPPEKSAKKMVTLPTRDDPRGPEREKRLAKLLAAEGRAAVTKATEDFVGAGFELPEEQEVALKVLDHAHDARVLTALESLGRLLEAEPPQRRTVLDARLRRLEDDADDAEVRALASTLRKRLSARPHAGR